MAIPIILKGETAKQITLALAEGYSYANCVLTAEFAGVSRTFENLVAGGTVALDYTACETARFPLGTSKVFLSIKNGAGEVKFLPWEKIKVTDSPTEVRAAVIRIDPATLDVTDATSKDSLAAVKSKLNAVMEFLRRTGAAWMLATLPMAGMCDVMPLYSAFEDIPGDEMIMTNVAPYVDAKTDAALGEFSRTNNILKAGPYLSATGGVVKTKGGITLHYTGVTLGAWPQNSWITPYGFGMFGGFLQEGIEFQNRNVYVSKTDRRVTMHFPLDDSWEDGADVGDLALRSDITITDLTSSTNYTDAALGAFAQTGAVARAAAYGTPTWRTDATGCVWEVTAALGTGYEDWNCSGVPDGYSFLGIARSSDSEWRLDLYDNDIDGFYAVGPSNAAYIVFDVYGAMVEARPKSTVTNLVGRVALTNDIPDTSGYVTPADVTSAIREHSLGGIYDSELGVWWTPHMVNGAYYWTATTNVNLNAEGN